MITGTKLFSDVMMHSKKINVSLLNNIYSLLVNYYNVTYDEDLDFFSIAKASWNLIHSAYRIII